jgi:hypothetical protein
MAGSIVPRTLVFASRPFSALEVLGVGALSEGAGAFMPLKRVAPQAWPSGPASGSRK